MNLRETKERMADMLLSYETEIKLCSSLVWREGRFLLEYKLQGNNEY